MNNIQGDLANISAVTGTLVGRRCSSEHLKLVISPPRRAKECTPIRSRLNRGYLVESALGAVWSHEICYGIDVCLHFPGLRIEPVTAVLPFWLIHQLHHPDN